MQPTSDVDGLLCCKNRFGVNPGKCFSKVDCVSGLKGVRAPHGDADNIDCSCEWNKTEYVYAQLNYKNEN